MPRLPALFIPLVLGACSSQSDPFTNRQAIGAAPTEAPTPVAAIEQAKIEAVTPEQANQLSGELRCNFADGGGRVLLAGSSNVGRNEPVDAVIAGDGRAIALQREVAGGFAALRRGGSFAGGGMRATVTVGDAEPTGNEGSVNTATLTLVPIGESARVASGRWSCGP